MGDNDKNNRNNNNTKKILLNIVYVLITVVFFIAIVVLFDSNTLSQDENRSFSELISDIREGKVSKITLGEGKKEFEVEVYKDPENQDRNNVETFTYDNLPPNTSSSALENIQNSLDQENFQIGVGEGQIIYSEEQKSIITNLLESQFIGTLFFVGIMLIVGFYFIKKIGDINGRSISFGNSRAKFYDDLKNKDKITFQDVAGNEEAKQELTEVVDFLKRPEEYLKMGAKIPRGVLLVGSPGNGKTLMAKAVAGEAGVPFLYVSGSEFVEMFVGVGASRVRDLFKSAQKKSPCVVFVDEIDAVGRQRGSGLGTGNDEREQTLNQILVELDGFEATSSIIVIGATNRPDVLDPALLRPGRFDRQVTVTAPDRKEREKILAVHSRNKKMSDDVDLGIIAKRTPGFSGADLMNVLNEAAIITVRERESKITNNILREAIEKVVLGPSLKSKLVSEEQRKLTAYHEAGHALIATVLPQANKVQKVTIIPRGKAGGYTFSDPGDRDNMSVKRSQFLSEITVLFGGYTVEEHIFGEVTTGASNDLAKATEIARDMVMKYGMSAIGPISFGEDKSLSFLGKDMMEGKDYSESSLSAIDNEVKKILDECHRECLRLIKQFETELHQLSEALLEKEVLEFEEFNEIVKHIANPPFKEPKNEPKEETEMPQA
jgi:cell division protease FtsH